MCNKLINKIECAKDDNLSQVKVFLDDFLIGFNNNSCKQYYEKMWGWVVEMGMGRGEYCSQARLAKFESRINNE